MNTDDRGIKIDLTKEGYRQHAERWFNMVASNTLCLPVLIKRKFGYSKSVMSFVDKVFKKEADAAQSSNNANMFIISKIFVELFHAEKMIDQMILKHTCDDLWVEPMIKLARDCLAADSSPAPAEKCKYCEYREKAGKVELS